MASSFLLSEWSKQTANLNRFVGGAVWKTFGPIIIQFCKWQPPLTFLSFPTPLFYSLNFLLAVAVRTKAIDPIGSLALYCFTLFILYIALYSSVLCIIYQSCSHYCPELLAVIKIFEEMFRNYFRRVIIIIIQVSKNIENYKISEYVKIYKIIKYLNI